MKNCPQCVHWRNSSSKTPLHIATENGHTSVVKYLLDNNTDVSSKDDKGDQPIHIASRLGHFECVIGIRSETPITRKIPMRVAALHFTFSGVGRCGV